MSYFTDLPPTNVFGKIYPMNNLGSSRKSTTVSRGGCFVAVTNNL